MLSELDQLSGFCEMLIPENYCFQSCLYIQPALRKLYLYEDLYGCAIFTEHGIKMAFHIRK